MSKPNELIQHFTKSPFLWGVIGCAGFYALVLVKNGPLNHPVMHQYFTYHPVEYMLTVMFAIGLASLIIKTMELVAQRGGLRESLFAGVPHTPQTLDECNALLTRLDRLPARRQKDYLVARLKMALEHVRQRGSADTLDDELKYLSDLDASRLQGGYGLFRVIVWAIPILGFLGTVIGITVALNSINLEAPDQSMQNVLGGLGLKFNTTALALTLSMALMFVHFYVEQAETALLDQVDRRAQTELSGRFAAIPTGGDGQIVAMHHMAEMIQQSTEFLLKRQAEFWQSAVDSAANRWAEMAELAGQHVAQGMSAASGELARRAAVLEQAVTAAGDVVRLEDALNQNLTALAGAKHFEQTVLSLAAAVNMLSARSADAPTAGAAIKLEPSRRNSHAA